MKQGVYASFIKRFLDVIVSFCALVILSPLLLILIVFVRMKLGSPVFFKQDRPGRDGQIFRLYKFRTMTEQKDEAGNLLPDEVRLTKFGRFLRSTSLDEIPELWNILKGDMSLVGPRPLLVSYLPLYNARQKRRHDVRPGLTGWAQVNGRNTITWEQKFEYDVYYVEHLSFRMDLKILWKTVEVVLKHDDINSATSATMEPFTGTKDSP